MPSLSDDAYNHLKKLVTDVSFRAGRLREWIALGRSLRVLNGSFPPFNTDAKAGAQNPAVLNLVRLNEVWRNIEDIPLMELESFRAPNGIRYINRALLANGGGDTDPTVAQWLDQLLELGGQIRGALDALRIQELSDHCGRFDIQLRQALNRHRAIVDSETDQLFMIATTLSTRLDS
jgi:hypothetical protein